MSLKFPISLVGKRIKGYEYNEPCADSITNPALTHVFYNNCAVEATYEGQLPSQQYDVRILGGSNFAKRLYIGTSCEHTGSYTFYGDNQLYGNLIFPENVKTIGYQCFFNTTKITSVQFLGSGVTTILGLAFQGCTSVTGTLSIPSSIETIQDRAFRFTTFNRIEIHAVVAPTIGANFTFAEMPNVSDGSIHVPSNATGYAASYNGLTVVYDLPAG
jgi:hypothetical protein